MTAAAAPRRELDHRVSDGLSVTLSWDPETGGAVVSVRDMKGDDAFELHVGPGERALDVFRHPYAYAAHRGQANGPSAGREVIRNL